MLLFSLPAAVNRADGPLRSAATTPNMIGCDYMASLFEQIGFPRTPEPSSRCARLVRTPVSARTSGETEVEIMQAGTLFSRTLIRPRTSKTFGWRLKGLLACLLLLVAWSLSPLRLGFVSGSSMAPTYRSGQPFLMTRADSTHPAVGSVVVFDHDGQPYIKRVAALEGQEIWGVTWSESGGRPDLLLPRGGWRAWNALWRKTPGSDASIHFTCRRITSSS